MKRLLAFLLSFALLASALSLTALGATRGGLALADGVGQSVSAMFPDYAVQYELDTASGALRIFCGEAGEQKMVSHVKTDWVPWLADPELMLSVKTVVVEEGVLSLGRAAFMGCENLTTVTLPASLILIEEGVFFGCNSLREIRYAGGEGAFAEIEYEESLNYLIKDDQRVDVRTLITYGESVLVRMVTDEGREIGRYRVGGHAAGERFTVTPKTLEHMTYSGRKSEITGKLRKGDDRVYTLSYTCDHAFAVRDLKKPCGSFCSYCGLDDPAAEEKHLFDVTEQTERSLLQKGTLHKVCRVCGTERHSESHPLGLFVAIGVGAVLLVAGITLAIVLPIRRRKRLRDLTW